MDIVEESKKELETKLVAYTEFMLDFKKGSNSIYSFYEGKEDRNYYSFRINLTTNSKKQKFHYTCNGKSNVIELEKLLYKNTFYSDSNLLFYVDKDFDKNNHLSNNIYVTKYYGIENFYSIEESFKNILVNNYQIPVNDENYRKAVELFNNCKNDFHLRIIKFNSWLACQSDYRSENQSSTRLNIEKSLKNYFSKDIFEKCVKIDFTIDLDNDISNPLIFPNIFPDAPIISDEKLINKIELFKTLKYDEIFRGKFELKFLVCFLKRFKDEISNKNSNIFSKKFTDPLRYEYVTTISQLTSCAITHDCLLEYIVNHSKN